MNKIRVLSMVVLMLILITGCATIKPPFELSNQFFLEKTMDGFDLAQVVSGVIPSGSRVAFCSLETDIASPIPVAALVEDQMIQSLGKSYRLLERDPRGLMRIIPESATGGYQLDQGNPDGNFQGDRYFATGLNSAEYIVAYRLQECGIYYEKQALSSTAVRKSFIRIHVRVYNAKTSAILLAENRISQKSDTIPKRLIRVLKNYDYSDFAPYGYPIQKGGK